MKGYIYKYTFPDGKIYIGQTKNIEKRRREHVDPQAGPKNTGFWEAYQKYGKYEFEIIRELEYDDIDELTYYLNLYESGYIHQFQSNNPMFGYNIKEIGTVAFRATKILQNKYNELKKNYLSKLTPIYESAFKKIFRTKKPLTDEEKQLILVRYKDRFPLPTFIENYNFDDLSKNKRNQDTLFWIEEHMGRINDAMNQEANRYATNYVNLHTTEIINEQRENDIIVQLDKEGNIVNEYNSFIEICQVFHVVRADNVRNVLRGKQKTAYGYYWKYKRDLI